MHPTRHSSASTASGVPDLISPVSFERAGAELLRAIRGRRSQTAFARRLGYAGNPSTQWERGTRHPTAVEMLRAATVVGLDVSGAFKRFVPLPPPDPSDLPLYAWLQRLAGGAAVQLLAARIGCSRHTVGRWLSGRAAPRVHEFLALLEVCTGRAHDWVAELVDIEAVPSLEPAFRRGRSARTVASDQPYSEAILRVLETVAYREQPAAALEALSAALGIGDSELHEVLQALTAAGIVEQRQDVLHVVRELSVQSDHQALRRLQSHWLEVARRRLSETNSDWFAYNVVSVSQADLHRIHECLKSAYVESRAIVASSEPSEVAAVVLMHLMKL